VLEFFQQVENTDKLKEMEHFQRVGTEIDVHHSARQHAAKGNKNRYGSP
jgi:hypothetical protein